MNNGPKKKIIILGAGLFAEEVADQISQGEEYEVAGFIEGINREKCQKKLVKLPVMWIDEIALLDKSYVAVCAVGSTDRYKFIQHALSLGLKFATVIHPGAGISPTTIMGNGVIVSQGAVIGAYTKVGDHTILNRGSLIGHHVQIGDYATISPGANIAGKCLIGNLCYIGMGAIILDGITIGDNSIVGSGAVVTKDVPERVQVVGVPARIVKQL
jgi:acetyltransferase EpsM